MEKAGISKYIIERIKEIYKETKGRVRVGEDFWEEFWTVKGLTQGCVLSPILFCIFIAGLMTRSTLSSGALVAAPTLAKPVYIRSVAATYLHGFSLFRGFGIAAGRRAMSYRGAKFAHTWTLTHARARGSLKPRDTQSPYGARRRWPVGISRLPFIHRESGRERDNDLQMPGRTRSALLAASAHRH